MSVKNDSDSRNWGMLCHLSALSCWLFPFGNILGPLIVWLIKKDQMPFVDEQGKESLNFQISLTIYFIAAIILSIFLIGIPFLIALPILQIFFVIVAAVKVSNGEEYQYPFTIRFIN